MQEAVTVPSQEPEQAPAGSPVQLVCVGSGRAPATMGAQTPAPAPVLTPLQLSQLPKQAESQHLPSGEQKPLAHWFAEPQATPASFFGTQLVPEQ
jgi:hypothetical protein